MNYINYCLNWGKELANSQYIAFNIILLILGLIGSIFIFYQMLKFINKLFTITKGSKEEKIQDKYYENEEKYYKNDLIKQNQESNNSHLAGNQLSKAKREVKQKKTQLKSFDNASPDDTFSGETEQ